MQQSVKTKTKYWNGKIEMAKWILSHSTTQFGWYLMFWSINWHCKFSTCRIYLRRSTNNSQINWNFRKMVILTEPWTISPPFVADQANGELNNVSLLSMHPSINWIVYHFNSFMFHYGDAYKGHTHSVAEQQPHKRSTFTSMHARDSKQMQIHMYIDRSEICIWREFCNNGCFRFAEMAKVLSQRIVGGNLCFFRYSMQFWSSCTASLAIFTDHSIFDWVLHS